MMKAVWLTLILAAFSIGGNADAATIRAGEIKAAVKAYIEKNMPWPDGNIRVFFPAKVQDIQASVSKITFEVRGKRNDSFIGDSFYTVNFYDEDVLIRQETIRAKLEVFLDVALSARALEKDSEITENDVRFEGRWRSEMPANAVTDLREMIGKRIVGSIRPNCEITKNMLKRYPLVRRGKMVRIVLDRGPLTVLTMGLSEEDGSRNDIVKIKNLSSSKIVYARVVNDNTVKIDF